MKLNADKCSFEVSSGKFLSFIINYKGIKVNPEKNEVLKNIWALTTIKKMQKLTGMIAVLNQFISKCPDICHPFFQALKGGKQLKWTEECDKALASLKEYFTSPPMISIKNPHK